MTKSGDRQSGIVVGEHQAEERHAGRQVKNIRLKRAPISRRPDRHEHTSAEGHSDVTGIFFFFL